MFNISKESFCECMQKLMDLNDNCDNAYHYFEKIGIDVNSVYSPLEDILLKILSESMLDKDGWIEWYVYETNFGRKKLTAYWDNGKYIIVLNTFSDLYNLLIGNPTLKVNK